VRCSNQSIIDTQTNARSYTHYQCTNVEGEEGVKKTKRRQERKKAGISDDHLYTHVPQGRISHISPARNPSAVPAAVDRIAVLLIGIMITPGFLSHCLRFFAGRHRTFA
jgi:hypothetical protein